MEGVSLDRFDLERLEFNKIKDVLRGYVSTSLGLEEVEDLSPLGDLDRIETEFRFVEEAFLAITTGEELPFASVTDVRDIANRSRIPGSILQPIEILRIRDHFLVAKKFKLLLKGYENLSQLADELVICEDVVDKIGEKIDDTGYIRDEASTELSVIRSRIRSVKNRIINRLRELINNPSISKALQDREIHFKGERYTLAIRNDMARFVKGIVVDVSSSGATLFVEPIGIVDLNNELVSLIGMEKAEERKILGELTSMIGTHARAILDNLRIIGKLDLVFAKAKFMIEYKANIPKVGRERRIEIIEGRHPLLIKVKGFDTTVPISVTLSKGKNTIIITGPNMGGKTVTLKTIGLLTLMALSAIPVTASRDSYFYFVDGVYADIGDEQNIEGSLSTFAGHIVNIKRILERATENSLVLIDELGTGTDPVEGSALATAITEKLHSLGSFNVITTHHNSLKMLALKVEGIENASVDFDPETLEPKYRLILGMVGSSNALYIARRIGLPEDIIDRASSMIGDRREEEEIKLGIKFREEAERMLKEAERIREEARLELDNAKREAERLILDARDRVESLIESVKRELRDSVGDLSGSKKADRVLMAKNILKEFVNSTIGNFQEIEIGDIVMVQGLNIKGKVVEKRGNSFRIDTGRMSMNVSKDSVRLVEKGSESVRSEGLKQSPRDINVFLERQRKTFFPEIDVRGMRVDEAIAEVDKFLNDALIFSFSEVRIIHGKGEGILRKAIEEYLKEFPYVRSFRLADESEGGSGVTVVYLDVR